MSYYFISENTDKNISWLDEKQLQAITPGEFLEKDDPFHDNVKGVVVLCESRLDENNKNAQRHQLQGISLVRSLRMDHQRRYPVLFVSFLPFPVIRKQTALSVLVESVGHDFLRLPCLSEHLMEKLKSLRELTPTELRDVQLFSCMPEGVINAKIHQLHLVADKILKDPEYTSHEASADLISCISEICFVANKDPNEIIADFKSSFPVLEKGNAGEACKYVKEQGERLIREMVSKTEISRFNAEKKRPWRLLMLDDELDKDSEISKLMESKGIDVVYRTNAEGAMRALDRDDRLRGKISLILCDYRLLEARDGNLFQQQTQGYTFLQKVGERFQSRIISAMVYSGMPRQFLLETFKTYKLRTEIFSKADFGFDNPGALDYLTTRIAELGDANYESMVALPLNNAQWAKSLHEWYVYFRSLKDYEQRELEISTYCTQWVNDYQTAKDPQTPLKKGATMQPLQKENEKCRHCGNNLPSQKTPDREINKDFEHFEDILKARRLAQYFYLKFRYWGYTEKNTLEKIHEILKPAGTGNSDLIRKQLRFKLGLKLSEFPMGATMEELNWIHYDMNIDVLGKYQQFRNKNEKTEELASDFILNWDNIKKLIQDNNYVIKLKKEKNNQSDKEKREKEEENALEFKKKEFKPYLFDRNDIGLLVRWLSTVVQEENNPEQMTDFMNEFLEDLKKVWSYEKSN